MGEMIELGQHVHVFQKFLDRILVDRCCIAEEYGITFIELVFTAEYVHSIR